MTLYERIRKLRIEKGMTQDDLAKALGYKDRSMITKIESGKVDISQKKIYAFAKALDVNPGWLMTGVEQKKSLPEFVNDSDKLRKVLINLQPKDYLMVWEAIDRNYQRMKANGEID